MQNWVSNLSQINNKNIISNIINSHGDQKIYHVTRSLSRIKAEGFKPRAETGIEGFGQGCADHNPNRISVTWCKQTALEYYNAMLHLAKIINSNVDVTDSINFLFDWFGVDETVLLEEPIPENFYFMDLSLWNYARGESSFDLDAYICDVGQLSAFKHFKFFIELNHQIEQRKSNTDKDGFCVIRPGVGIMGKYHNYSKIKTEDIALLQLEVAEGAEPEQHDLENELLFNASDIRILDIIKSGHA